MHCFEVARGLKSKGHEVSVLTSRYGYSRGTIEGDVFRLLFLEAHLQHYRPLHFFIKRESENSYNLSILKKTISENRPDVVVFWGMWNLSRTLPAAAESGKLPVAYWFGDLWPIRTPDIHTAYWQQPTRRRATGWIKSQVAKIAIHQLDREGYPPTLLFENAACGSHFIRSELAKHFPAFTEAKIVLCGIDLKRFETLEPATGLKDALSPRLLYLGGISSHKGVHTAVEAVGHLVRHYPRISLTLAGKGHYAYVDQLDRLAQGLAVAVNIRVAGEVTQDEIPGVLRQHDILIVPSIPPEPFGRVIAEGMAAGIPVVGTATGGSAEMLKHRETGLVFQPEDSAGLAACIQELVQDQQLFRRLAKAGKDASARFSLSQMIDEFETFLEGIQR
jgi:glycosyltransferase involved in cell wall biosynthesis